MFGKYLGKKRKGNNRLQVKGGQGEDEMAGENEEASLLNGPNISRPSSGGGSTGGSSNGVSQPRNRTSNGNVTPFESILIPEALSLKKSLIKHGLQYCLQRPQDDNEDAPEEEGDFGAALLRNLPSMEDLILPPGISLEGIERTENEYEHEAVFSNGVRVRLRAHNRCRSSTLVLTPSMWSNKNRYTILLFESGNQSYVIYGMSLADALFSDHCMLTHDANFEFRAI